MGNLIVSNDFLSYTATGTATTGYPAENVGDYWHLKRRFRSSIGTTGNIIELDLGSSKAVKGVFLNDVNFTAVNLQRYDSGSWTTVQAVTVSKDEIVNRYKAFIPVDFTDSKFRLNISSGSPVDDTVWRIGSIVALGSYTEFAHNMSYGFNRTARQAFSDLDLPHGGIERISLGDNLRWECEAAFMDRRASYESDLWTLNAMNPSAPMIFYENQGDDSQAYLCVRDDFYKGTISAYNVVTGEVIKFRELI